SPPEMGRAGLSKEWQEWFLDQFTPTLATDSKAGMPKLRKVTVGKFAGLEGTTVDAGAAFVTRYVMVGKRIFLLTVEARTEDDAKRLAATLFASFEVLPEFARSAEAKPPAWERFQFT